MTSATARSCTPSSATACSVDPAGAVHQRQKEQACGVKPVHRRPAVGPGADGGRHALAAGDADQGSHEAVISVAVNRRSESHVRRANSPSGERR